MTLKSTTQKPLIPNISHLYHYLEQFRYFLLLIFRTIRAKNSFVKNGTANFSQNSPTEICGPPPAVIPSIPVRRNRNRNLSI